MSFMNKMESGKSPSVSSVLTLLKNPKDWDLESKGDFLEKFKHKETGWYFYTGVDMVRLYRNDSYNTFVLDIGFIRHLWFSLTNKEKKFAKKWLKETQ
jgi:hypothetical protein